MDTSSGSKASSLDTVDFTLNEPTNIVSTKPHKKKKKKKASNNIDESDNSDNSYSNNKTKKIKGKGKKSTKGIKQGNDDIESQNSNDNLSDQSSNKLKRKKKKRSPKQKSSGSNDDYSYNAKLDTSDLSQPVNMDVQNDMDHSDVPQNNMSMLDNNTNKISKNDNQNVSHISPVIHQRSISRNNGNIIVTSNNRNYDNRHSTDNNSSNDNFKINKSSKAIEIGIDPYIANRSDSVRGGVKKCRRNDFSVIGCWIVFISLILLMFPPIQFGSTAVSLWFGLCYLVFVLSYSYATIPFQSFAPQFCVSENEIIKHSYYSFIIQNIGLVITFFVLALLPNITKNESISTDQVLESCYRTDGTGISCKINPYTHKTTHYDIFHTELFINSNNLWNSTSNSCVMYHNKTYNSPNELFRIENCVGVRESTNPCMSQFCTCIAECNGINVVNGTRLTFIIYSFIFGFILLASIRISIYYFHKNNKFLKEKLILLTPSQPLLSTLFHAFKNKLLMSFIIPHTLDQISYFIIFCMMLFYVRSVVVPEYSTSLSGGIECNQGFPVIGTDSNNILCNSQSLSSLLLMTMIISTILFSPMWWFICSILGRTRTWQLSSLLFSIFLLGFLFASQSKISEVISIAFLMGIPIGGRFVIDSILMDVIHYDEFLTGNKNEALFIMFKTFILKLCIIPALLIPTATLYGIGYIPPIHYINQLQNKQVVSYCRMLIIGIPSLLSLLSFLFKLKFRLIDIIQYEMIIEGIQQHKVGFSALDPISGKQFRIPKMNDREYIMWGLFNHFPSLDSAVKCHACVSASRPQVGVKLLTNKIRDEGIIDFILIAGCCAGISVTTQYFYNKTNQNNFNNRKEKELSLMIIPAKEDLGAFGWSLTTAEIDTIDKIAAKNPKQLIQNFNQSE
eukprot:gene6679-9163_t